MIANIRYVKEVMGELRAKKKYGQNFLIDANIVDRIARIACDEDLLTIEIGPGLGALSEMLLKYSKAVDAYEIDTDMYEILQRTIADERFRVTCADFLDADLSSYQERVNVCGNLPYYVTTPILFRLFESDLDINRITIMVQKEVGERISAKPGSEEYGALSVEVQYLFEVKQELNVSRSVFYPMPNVDSIVLSMRPVRDRDHAFERDFFAFVKNCFRMRRKTLHNNLKDLYADEVLDRVYDETGIRKETRAQQLTLDDFLRLYETLSR
jgi:16S rRNA (adenine1518-N6/adenine1519-N6)-dimethyltransferase